MASSVSKVNEWQEIPQKLRRSTTEAKVEAKDLGNTPHNELIHAVVKEAEQGAQDSINTVDVERYWPCSLHPSRRLLLAEP